MHSTLSSTAALMDCFSFAPVALNLWVAADKLTDCRFSAIVSRWSASVWVTALSVTCLLDTSLSLRVVIASWKQSWRVNDEDEGAIADGLLLHAPQSPSPSQLVDDAEEGVTTGVVVGELREGSQHRFLWDTVFSFQLRETNYLGLRLQY